MAHRSVPFHPAGAGTLAAVLASAVLSSCAYFAPAYFAPASFAPHRPLPEGATERSFATPSELDPAWTPLAPGLDFCAALVRDPPLRLRALRADLSGGRIVPVVGPLPSAAGMDAGKSEETISSILTTSFARDYGCLAAVNANPFDKSTDTEGIPLKTVGIAVSDGRVLSPPNPRYAALLFSAAGRARVVEQADIRDGDAIRNAIGGFFVVLKGGSPVGNDRIRNPRTAAAVGADGKTLYLLVVDGRTAASVGTTARETGLLLRLLGGQDGLILDGGGSSAMAIRGEDGAAFLANVPVHGGMPGRQRAVGICLGVREGK